MERGAWERGAKRPRPPPPSPSPLVERGDGRRERPSPPEAGESRKSKVEGNGRTCKLPLGFALATLNGLGAGPRLGSGCGAGGAGCLTKGLGVWEGVGLRGVSERVR